MHPIWQVSIIQSPIPYFPVKTMVKQQKSADFLTNEIGCHPYNAAVEVFASLYDSSLVAAPNNNNARRKCRRSLKNLVKRFRASEGVE